MARKLNGNICRVGARRPDAALSERLEESLFRRRQSKNADCADAKANLKTRIEF